MTDVIKEPLDANTKAPLDAPDLAALSDLAPQLAQTFVSIASDIALVIDADGVIRHMAMGADPIAGSNANWVGRPWAETVSGGTRRKIEQLLIEAQTTGVTRRREVNHPTIDGHDVPVAYTAIRLGRDGPVLAVGRDLRAVAAIQERFNVAQQDMERHYWKQRQSESRYRQLFQVATDAVLVVDALTLRIIEANLAAGTLFGCTSDALVGQSATVGVAHAARPGVDEVLMMARTSGRPAEIRALAAPARNTTMPLHTTAIDISATSFRAGNTMLLLVRARAATAASDSTTDSRLTEFVEHTPDAVTITDSSGRVMMANPAFAALCRLPADGQVVGQNLVELLGDPQNMLRAILTEARHDGIAERREAVVGRHDALRTEVEISATLLAEGDQECIGLTLRRIDQRARAPMTLLGELPIAIADLAAKLGAKTLPEMLQEVAVIAERHLMGAALNRTQGEHVEAARLLGISADDLSSRMRALDMPTNVDVDGETRGPATPAPAPVVPPPSRLH